MSDIRAQSRDAEFDRLLAERASANPSEAKFTEDDMRDAIEMGKRHGMSELLGELERERHIAMEEA